MVFQGPTKSGTDVKKFRDTGESVPSQSKFQGPIAPGTSEKEFRRSGRSKRRRAGPVQPSFDEEIFRQTGRSIPRGSQQATDIRSQLAQEQSSARQQALAQKKAGTLVGQRDVGVITGGVIEPARTTQEQIEAVFDRPVKPAPGFDLELIKKAGREFFFVEGTPIKAVGTLLSPLQRFFPQTKAETKKTPAEFLTGGILRAGRVQTAITGLISSDLLISEKDILKRELERKPEALIPLEARAEQVASEIKQEITPGLQEKVTTGILTVEQAEKQFQEQFQPEFEKRTGGEFRSTARLKGAVERSLQPSIDIAKGAELGAFFAASTTPVGLVLSGASLVARGQEKILTAPTLFEKGVGFAEATIGAVIGGSSVRLAERIADQALIQEVIAKRGRITGREVFRDKDQSLFRIRSERSLGPDASLRTEIISPTFRTGKDTFSITGGRGVSKLDVFSTETGGRRIFIETFSFGGRQTIQSAAPRIVTGGAKITLPKLQPTVGRGFVQQFGKETFKEFGFGGVSSIVKTPAGKIVRIDAGQITGLRLSNLGGFKPVFGVKIPIQESGIIRLISGDVGGGGVVRSGSGSLKTTLEQTFSPGGVISGIEKTIFKPTVVTDITSGIVGTITKTVTDVKPQARGGFVQSAKLDIKLDSDVRGGLDTKSIAIQTPQITQAPKVSSRQQILPISIQLPVSEQAQRQSLVPGLDLVQRQALLPQSVFAPSLAVTSFGFGTGGGFGFPLIVPPIPRVGTGKIVKRTGKRKKKRIAPGFTGIITGGIGLPEPGRFGISPFTLRGLKNGRAKKGTKALTSL